MSSEQDARRRGRRAAGAVARRTDRSGADTARLDPSADPSGANLPVGDPSGADLPGTDPSGTAPAIAPRDDLAERRARRTPQAAPPLQLPNRGEAWEFGTQQQDAPADPPPAAAETGTDADQPWRPWHGSAGE